MADAQFVVFLLGPPGAGKGTLGPMLAEHLSVGELLRDPALVSSGALAPDEMLSGRLVPSARSAEVLLQALKRLSSTKGFIVDGFPRSTENWQHWSVELEQSNCVKGVIVLYCDDTVATTRCMARQHMRSDDTPSVIARRLATYHAITVPAIESLRAILPVIEIDGMKKPSQVFYRVVQQLQEKLMFSWVEQPDQRLVFLEGNIGSGKTSLMNAVSDLAQVELCFEPIEQWTDYAGFNLLDLAYRDPPRWSFAFQSAVLQTCRTTLEEVQSTRLRVCERSAYSAQLCFGAIQRASGALNSAEWGLLDHQFQRLHRRIAPRRPTIIYLRTSPEVAYQRMCQRGRHEEESVPLEYLQKLHDAHEHWLNREGFAKDGFSLDIRTLDGDQPQQLLIQQFRALIEKLIQ